MDYKEALAYLNAVEFFGSKPGLERMASMLDALGNPQEEMKFVHIAVAKKLPLEFLTELNL